MPKNYKIKHRLCCKGYDLTLNSFQPDINECNDGENGGCQFQCVDTTGSYYCSCPTGFTLAYDLHGCEGMLKPYQTQKI